MRGLIVWGLIFASSAVFAQNWTNKTVWKVAGKSAYSDTPPHLRLQNVQIFYPRTKKLSPVINEMAYKPSPPEPVETTYNVEHISEKQIEEWVSSAFLAKQILTQEERERRTACQSANEQLQQAMQSQNQTAMQHAEAQVVQHCVGDVQAAF